MMIATGTKEGIQGNIAQPDGEPRSYVTIYVQVDDVTASLNLETAVDRCKAQASAYRY